MTGGSPWLLCREPRPHAVMRLYCLAHSGGSAGEYLLWSGGLPGHEVWGVQPPGRGSRLEEPPFTTMSDLVGALADEVEFDGPYCLFGHSLGAAVAYELTLELRARGRELPARLYVSAHEAPHLHRQTPSLLEMDDEALLREVEQSYDPIPQELREDREWFSLLLRGLRADLRIVAGYTPTPAAPLPVPVTAMGGTADSTVSPADLAAWAAYSTGSFRLRTYPGRHFYFREQQHDVLDDLAADLARCSR